MSGAETITLPREALLEFFGQHCLPPWQDSDGNWIGGSVDCAPLASVILEWLAANEVKPWDPIADSDFDRELSYARVLSAPADSSCAVGMYPADEREATTDADKANLIGSKLHFGTSFLGDLADLHAPVIDIDIECHLVPSSTPGHSHLYIEAPMPWGAYMTLLEALRDAEIVEPGYVAAAVRRGQTHVRKPGVLKAGEA